MSRILVDGEDANALPPSSPKELCPAIYGACLQHPDKLFSQEDLLALKIIPNDDMNLLIACLNDLTNQRRFTTLTQGQKYLWKVVKREDAARYKGLSQDESVVLSYVDNAQREGIWVKHIRGRSGMHQTNVANALRRLEQKNIVKQIASAKYPKRKVYMLAHLQPSEDVTGGPFFTDGILDEEYVFHMTNAAYRFVTSRSWDFGHNAKSDKDSRSTVSTHSLEALREKEIHRAELRKRIGPLPMPPGYTAYPTLADVTQALNSTNISNIPLVEGDVKQLLDILCWDGRLVRVLGGMAYKSVKGADESIEGKTNTNGLAEIPCGRCPVFEWCEDGGPVNARTCKYFGDWLTS